LTDSVNLNILYSDNHLLVVRKPAGMLVQGDHTGDISLLDAARQYLKVEFNKPGKVFLGLVHRLDRPVSGVVVFARTSKAASRISEQIRLRKVRKIYWALVRGEMDDHGVMEDFIVRRRMSSRIVKEGGQHAKLAYRLLAYRKGVSWVEIELMTGRHHQIRVQFSSRGHPILGDLRYGAKEKFCGNAFALHARSFSLTHPTRRGKMTFEADPDICWQEYILYNAHNSDRAEKA